MRAHSRCGTHRGAARCIPGTCVPCAVELHDAYRALVSPVPQEAKKAREGHEYAESEAVLALPLYLALTLYLAMPLYLTLPIYLAPPGVTLSRRPCVSGGNRVN